MYGHDLSNQPLATDILRGTVHMGKTMGQEVITIRHNMIVTSFFFLQPPVLLVQASSQMTVEPDYPFMGIPELYA